MTLWTKLPFKDFLFQEMKRPDFMPFVVGGFCVLLMGAKINFGIDEETKKGSEYHRQFILGDKSHKH
eukprot:CAMPEP_0113934244 /NCGR_PEP_ID=MMETSP1339-20121228/1588_1 /TAXON_ID=94617 /ORGANISM="Fibrocapsa japonica" /LENGTH=66 /DNA_ID=CAMNT_0000935963 /DNA_START=142 /DNA_END=342 /DNA_ORIENTATION=+ /assembly_acc=CAM_ASM_000762